MTRGIGIYWVVWKLVEGFGSSDNKKKKKKDLFSPSIEGASDKLGGNELERDYCFAFILLHEEEKDIGTLSVTILNDPLEEYSLLRPLLSLLPLLNLSLWLSGRDLRKQQINQRKRFPRKKCRTLLTHQRWSGMCWGEVAGEPARSSPPLTRNTRAQLSAALYLTSQPVSPSCLCHQSLSSCIALESVHVACHFQIASSPQPDGQAAL